MAVNNRFDGCLERVSQAEANSIIEYTTSKGGLTVADLVESPDFLEGLGTESLKSLGAEHLKIADILDGTGAHVGDQRLQEGELISG
jgi:hypothetical protein